MIYVFLGPSGVGKTSVATQTNLPEIKSTTTRAQRVGETGTEYHFVTPEEFENLNLVERIQYAENWYGLQADDIQRAIDSNEDHFIILDSQGVKEIKKLFKNNVRVIYFIAHPNKLTEFMKNRGDSKASINRRLKTMREAGELKNHHLADIVIPSTTLEQMLAQTKQYIKKEH